jgi:hypothetical protein
LTTPFVLLEGTKVRCSSCLERHRKRHSSLHSVYPAQRFPHV